MNEFPIYLDTALSAEETEKAIRRGTLTSEGTSPFEVSSAILGEKRFAVQVQNRTGTALKNIEVSVETPNVVSGSAKQTIAEIGPEAKARAEFELKKAISAQDCNLKVSVQEQTSKVKKSDVLNLRAILVQKAAKPLVIDGDLSDWPKNVAAVKLDQRNAVKLPKTKWGANEEKIRAELRELVEHRADFPLAGVGGHHGHDGSEDSEVITEVQNSRLLCGKGNKKQYGIDVTQVKRKLHQRSENEGRILRKEEFIQHPVQQVENSQSGHGLCLVVNSLILQKQRDDHNQNRIHCKKKEPKR